MSDCDVSPDKSHGIWTLATWMEFRGQRHDRRSCRCVPASAAASGHGKLDDLMVRITTQATDDELVLKLEGCLAGAWVRELDICWRDAVERLNGRRMRVDLTGVCHADAAGRALMALMYRAGARFVTSGCVMPEVVREISESIALGASGGASGGQRS